MLGVELTNTTHIVQAAGYHKQGVELRILCFASSTIWTEMGVDAGIEQDRFERCEPWMRSINALTASEARLPKTTPARKKLSNISLEHMLELNAGTYQNTTLEMTCASRFLLDTRLASIVDWKKVPETAAR